MKQKLSLQELQNMVDRLDTVDPANSVVICHDPEKMRQYIGQYLSTDNGLTYRKLLDVAPSGLMKFEADATVKDSEQPALILTELDKPTKQC